MSQFHIDLLHAGIRSCQLCVIIAGGLAVNEYGWAAFLLLPLLLLVLWAWQVLYENIP